MSPSLEQITQDALELSPKQRSELIDALVESFDKAPTDSIQKLWIDEAHRRLDEIRSGRVQTIPGQDVIAEAQRLVKR